MTSFNSFLDNVMLEDYVYIKPATIDSNGDFSFSSYESIKCYSERKHTHEFTKNNETVESESIIYTKHFVQEGGYLIEGTNYTYVNSPLELNNCYKIKSVEIYKDLKGNIKYYKAWL